MSVFLSADILLPQVEKLEKWSVIACDQFTSQPEYWKAVRRYADKSPSAINLIFPEAELDDDREKQIEKINSYMDEYVTKKLFTEYMDCYVYVERTLLNGKIRKGIVGMVDLEKYDYRQNSTSYIRATEQTVVERIPPRVKIRCNAMLELSHTLLFCDDSENILMEFLEKNKNSLHKIYDLELMMGGGSIKGWLVQGEVANNFNQRLQIYEETIKNKYKEINQEPMLYAVGDGNHSLATAKTCYEELKKNHPEKDLSNHPARYAMVELENIHDDAQKFEPIHRIVTDINVCKLLTEMKEAICSQEGIAITYYYGENQGVLYLKADAGQLAVEIIQSFLDKYLNENDGNIDYIHGEDVLQQLSKEDNTIGFVLPTINKAQLFSEIIKNGVLPRKTFSMGHAKEKRYYMEVRKIR